MDKTVLCYLYKDHSYLLMYRNKKINDINHDKYIGIGGHLEKGETKEEALIREVKEETGLTLNSFKYRGELMFINGDYQEVMYLYLSDDFSGELSECDEGELVWVNEKVLLSLNMWEGDKYFLEPLINTDSFIKMTLTYDGDQLVSVVKEY